jgi:nitrite reductase/ring-hydroxylating ferredoxin subunit
MLLLPGVSFFGFSTFKVVSFFVTFSSVILGFYFACEGEGAQGKLFCQILRTRLRFLETSFASVAIGLLLGIVITKATSKVNSLTHSLYGSDSDSDSDFNSDAHSHFLPLLIPLLVFCPISLLTSHFSLSLSLSQSSAVLTSSLRSIRNIEVDRRRLKSFPSPFPHGWYKLTNSSSLFPGHMIEVRALGQLFAVFRGGEDRKAYVIDAECPHLGANLTQGGRIVGDTVECPWHRWLWKGDGICAHIPYQVPSSSPSSSSFVFCFQVIIFPTLSQLFISLFSSCLPFLLLRTLSHSLLFTHSLTHTTPHTYTLNTHTFFRRRFLERPRHVRGWFERFTGWC